MRIKNDPDSFNKETFFNIPSVFLSIVVLLVLVFSPAGGTDAPVMAHLDALADTTPDNTVYLPIIFSADNNIVSSVLTPFDANKSDLVGPSSWAANYGKTPEIIVVSNGVALDILAQDYDPATPWTSVLLHVVPKTGTAGYRVTQTLTGIPMLDRVMGLAIDSAGNRYYATGVDESKLISSSYPPLNTYRSNIVRVIKLNQAGEVMFNVDLDTARYAFSNSAEMIINPMVAGTSRLAVGGNEIALVHGNNTAPDSKLNGTRHQKALSTRLNTDGAVTWVSSVWVSHSFDQRLLFDGTEIIEHHLGDAYPRQIVFGRNHTYPLFHIKGALGENLTATRLGNVDLINNDPTYGYIALFATESTSTAGGIYTGMINGPRNLAIVRMNRGNYSVDPSLPSTLTVTSSNTQQTNRVKWLTQYTEGSKLHAERPKLIALGNDTYIVLWEEWLNAGSYSDTFNGVYAMIIDDKGTILRPAALITNKHHLPRGDDAFLLNNCAGWVTGNAAEKKLYIHLVDANLNYQMMILD
jgi:hypothetical protein